MTESLRDKLIRCGWVTPFNVNTLVKLIERHYDEDADQPELPGVHGQWINSSECPPTKEYAALPDNLVQRLIVPEKCVVAYTWDKLGKDQLWRPFSDKDTRPVVSETVDTSTEPTPAPQVKKSIKIIKRVKLVHITRTIDPKTRIHYLDAIDENGKYWMAQQTHQVEKWLTFSEPWRPSPQVPVEET